jgi:hypothetical protein
VAERLKAPVLKTGRRATVSWVRIPPHPPTPFQDVPSDAKKCGTLRFGALTISVDPKRAVKWHSSLWATIRGHMKSRGAHGRLRPSAVSRR